MGIAAKVNGVVITSLKASLLPAIIIAMVPLLNKNKNEISILFLVSSLIIHVASQYLLTILHPILLGVSVLPLRIRR